MSAWRFNRASHSSFPRLTSPLCVPATLPSYRYKCVWVLVSVTVCVVGSSPHIRSDVSYLRSMLHAPLHASCSASALPRSARSCVLFEACSIPRRDESYCMLVVYRHLPIPTRTPLYAHCSIDRIARYSTLSLAGRVLQYVRHTRFGTSMTAVSPSYSSDTALPFRASASPELDRDLP